MAKIFLIIFSFFFVSTAFAQVVSIAPIMINGVSYSKVNYMILKTNVVSKIQNRNITPLSYSDVSNWIAMANRELQVCKFSLTNVTQKNLIDKINQAISLCP